VIADLGARVTETEIIVELPADVLFDFDRAEIRPDAVPSLRQVAELIRASPAGRESQCDGKGGKD
jgi:outer membrane protein OmpA-like peptidoglycan-associated protein